MDPKEPLDELLLLPQRLVSAAQRPDIRQLRIYDTTLRDGEQMPGIAFSPDQKYSIARALSDIGVHIIDLAYPSVSPSEHEFLRLVCEGRQAGELRDSVELLIMCRADEQEVDDTLTVLQKAGFLPDEVTFLIFSSSSSLHVKYKLGATLLRRESKSPDRVAEMSLDFFHDANIRMVVDAIQHARSRGITDIEFGSEDASRTHLERLIPLVRAAIGAGASRYIFPDTTGSLTPEATRFYCKALRSAFPDIELASHFHNDFDLATSNTIAGIFHGFTTFAVTVNGIGERAGNAPLHSVVAALKYLFGFEIPGFKYEQLRSLRRLVEEATGVPVAVNEPVIGRNACYHESGIHTSGVEASRHMYEPIPFHEVGASPKFLYGKHTGSATLFHLLSRRQNEIEAEVTNQFVQTILQELKREREGLISPRTTAAYINSYYSNLSELGFTEDDVVEIARRIACRNLQLNHARAGR
jgi:isopropylmalate/homocitrate/citramalate synthase